MVRSVAQFIYNMLEFNCFANINLNVKKNQSTHVDWSISHQQEILTSDHLRTISLNQYRRHVSVTFSFINQIISMTVLFRILEIKFINEDIVTIIQIKCHNILYGATSCETKAITSI